MKRQAYEAIVRGVLTAGVWACATSAWGITIDGRFDPAEEWHDAQVVITDLNEAAIGQDSYDIERICLYGSDQLYVAFDVWNGHPQFSPAPPIITGRAFLNFDFNSVGAETHYYGLTYNDHKGFEPGHVHLIEYDDATRGAFTCLGRVDTFAVDEVIEMAVPWDLFPAIADGARQVQFDDYSFVYNNGGIYVADDASNATVAFNNALPVVPEPLTLLTLLPGCGLAGIALLRRLRQGKRGASQDGRRIRSLEE